MKTFGYYQIIVLITYIENCCVEQWKKLRQTETAN